MIATGTKSAEIESMRTQTSILKRCDSPYIIKFYDSFEIEDTFYIVLEYAPMGDLWTMINRRGMISEWGACNIIKQVISGLYYLHSELHVIHWYYFLPIKAHSVSYINHIINYYIVT